MAKRGPKPPLPAPAGAPASIPKPPDRLSVAERRQWRELAGRLAEVGFVSELDADALELYCALWSRYREAEKHLKKEGCVITAPNQYRQPNPWYLIQTQCLKDIRTFQEQFGLNPRSRSKMPPREVETVDPKWEGLD